jgi:hypothetical protein
MRAGTPTRGGTKSFRAASSLISSFLLLLCSLQHETKFTLKPKPFRMKLDTCLKDQVNVQIKPRLTLSSLCFCSHGPGRSCWVTAKWQRRCSSSRPGVLPPCLGGSWLVGACEHGPARCTRRLQVIQHDLKVLLQARECSSGGGPHSQCVELIWRLWCQHSCL